MAEYPYKALVIWLVAFFRYGQAHVPALGNHAGLPLH